MATQTQSDAARLADALVEAEARLIRLLVGCAAGEAPSNGTVADWEIPVAELQWPTHRRVLGEGGFASVVAGSWRGNAVAIKEAHVAYSSADALSEFVAEVSVLRRLQHLNVVHMYGACVDPPRVFVVLELLQGGTLFDAIRSRSLCAPDRMHVARGIARGMTYLHAQEPPVLHRDLKSLNILLSEDLTPKVSDFGISYTGVSATASSGTLNWMSPETMRSGTFTVKSDVYSFAMVLFEIFSGEVPYSSMLASDIIRNVIELRVRPTIPRGMPSTVRNVMAKAWHHEPLLRPTFLEIQTRFDASSSAQSKKKHALPLLSKRKGSTIEKQ